MTDRITQSADAFCSWLEEWAQRDSRIASDHNGPNCAKAQSGNSGAEEARGLTAGRVIPSGPAFDYFGFAADLARTRANLDTQVSCGETGRTVGGVTRDGNREQGVSALPDSYPENPHPANAADKPIVDAEIPPAGIETLVDRVFTICERAEREAVPESEKWSDSDTTRERYSGNRRLQ